jgi:hypothetical protein
MPDDLRKFPFTFGLARHGRRSNPVIVPWKISGNWDRYPEKEIPCLKAGDF